MRQWMIGLISLTVISGTACAQEVFPRINPGMWEYLIETKIEVTSGTINVVPPHQDSTTLSLCVKPDEAELKPENLNQEGCTVTDLRSDASFIEMDLSCRKDMKTYEGTVRTDVSDGGNKVNTELNLKYHKPRDQDPEEKTVIFNSIKGKRLGDCSA